MHKKQDFLIRVIDDEQYVLGSLALLLDVNGYRSECYDNAEDFLISVAPSVPGCILSDIRMPRMSGMELLFKMKERQIEIPIIFITGHGDIEMAVEAMKNGAVDFLVKPVKEAKLFEAINKALDFYIIGGSEKEYKERLSTLSNRERTVLELTLRGLDTQAITEKLGLSDRTIQGYRWRTYQKLGLNSIDQLIKIIRLEWLD